MGRGPTLEYHKNMMKGYVKGTLTCLSAEYIKNNVNTDFPLVLNIEPTNACNLSCYLCPRNKGMREVGYMDPGLFKKIIDECKGHRKLKMVNFHKDGEPLLHPKIYEMIRYAADNKVAEILHLNTNALMLNEDNCRQFLLCGIDDVTISIDAARACTFSDIKGADLLDKVETNVETLMKIKRTMGLAKPFVRTKIMEFEDVEGEEIKEFIGRWKGRVDDVQVTGVHNWSGAIDQLKVTDETKPTRFPCNLLWYTIAINWDGVVSACNIDWNLSAVLGDVKKDTIHMVWNGNSIKKLRRAELDGNHSCAEVCKDCILWASGDDLTDWFRKRQEFYV